ncbi:MAG: hypothetical protein RMJ98_12410 [Myxococcales bacterium]|nr:hypothetical protein [Polyangiaceae bacterium]MDW8250089.1 hypothetical protein [Myxococcales bacterium]
MLKQDQIDHITSQRSVIKVPICIGKEFFCNEIFIAQPRHRKRRIPYTLQIYTTLVHYLQLDGFSSHLHHHTNPITICPGFTQHGEWSAKQTDTSLVKDPLPQNSVTISRGTQKIYIPGYSEFSTPHRNGSTTCKPAFCLLQEERI